jgi:DNA-binding XRE family transcriptional regulator
MTQFELAEAIGVDDTTISKIEKGTRQPSIEVFSRLSQVFGAIFALQFIEGLND